MVPIADRVLVVGLARSGRAAAAALNACGSDVVGYDADGDLDVSGIDGEIVLGEWSDALLFGVELVVKSPGVPAQAPPMLAAVAHGIPVISEIELGARLLASPIVGITGTNGKTTTTGLLGAMFDAAGLPAEVAGNIGRPLTSLVGAVADDTWVVCELSSFQLEDVDTLHCRIAVLLNLEPDHLDRHGTFDAYADAKLRIFENQAGSDVAIVPRGFGQMPGAGRRVEFAADDPLPAEPLIPGAHNRENAAAATAAARAAGIPDDAIAEALRTFPGVEHRIEDIATIAGVRYVNDSKATNVAAALRALASFPGAPKRVILGGRGKAEPYAPLAAAFAPGDRAYLIGEATEAIAAALDASRSRLREQRRPALGGRRRGARTPRRATSCSSRRPAPATTSSRVTKSAGRSSGSWCRSSRGETGDSVTSRSAGQLEQRLLVLVTLGLVAFGLVMVFSATSASAALGAGDPMTFLVKQGAYAAVGLVLLALASRFDYHRLRAIAPILLIGALFLCVAVLVAAPPINGARRWFLVGPISVQPSELAKIAVLVWTCALLARRPAPRTMGELMKPLGLVVGLFCVLVLLEPDLGTTIALCLMVGGILVVSEVPFRLLALGGSIALVLGAAAIYMEPYRRARFLSFMDPWQDPQGAGFQTVQAIIGMGSGGHHRRGARPGHLEDLLPSRGAHRHDLRHRRRGARADRLHARDRRLRRLRLGRLPHRAAVP